MMREWSSRDVLGCTSRLSAVFWIYPTQFGITRFGVNCKTKIWEGVVKLNWSGFFRCPNLSEHNFNIHILRQYLANIFFG